MKKDRTLEEEFEVRETACRNVVRMVESFCKTVVLYIEKKSLASQYVLTDTAVEVKMLELATEEMEHLNDLFSDILAMSRICLLPSFYMGNLYEMLGPHIEKVGFFRPDCYRKDTYEAERSAYQSCIQLANLSQQVKYGCCVANSPDAVAFFNRLMQRYERENEKVLDDYMEDVVDAREARAELKKELKENTAVDIWIKSGQDIEKTIHEMDDKGCVEKDLLPLLEYKAKYARLANMKKAIQSTPTSIHIDKVVGTVLGDANITNDNQPKLDK